MAVRRQKFEPVTLRHIRSHGCHDILIYCGSVSCNHSAKMNADYLPEETVILALGPKMACATCGYIGADVRPDWSPLVNKRHV